MHPNKVFAWEDREAVLRFVAERGFAHIFTASEAGLFVVHAPVLLTEAGRVQFHISRRNRVADHLPGRVLISILGREAYQSANWYESEDQVPTWHYEAVEIEGEARPLSPEELVDFLDHLSDRFEREVQPENPWTRGKMTPGKFEAMTRAIVGFEVDPIELRAMRKFNQHKKAEDLAATIEGQAGAGREDIVAAISEVTRSG
jgi:transcriptional regulator